MRPINLIPKEQRPARGLAAGHSGFAPYVALGVLGLALIGMLAVVLTSNKVNSQRDKAAKLERETHTARAAADALRPYGDFAKLQQARLTTLQSLANTSFNWERVLRSLGRAIPSNVWLTRFTGTVAPDVSIESAGGGGEGSYRGKAPGPAVELVGCTYSQHAVARMMVRMRSLDGVTQVVLSKSERPEGEQDSQGSQSGGESGGGDDCRTSYRITKFELLVVLSQTAFAAPQSSAAPGAPSPVASAQSAASGTSSGSSSGGSQPYSGAGR
jgi:Tfp pilus assembly protein PilN